MKYEKIDSTKKNSYYSSDDPIKKLLLYKSFNELVNL